MPHPKNVKGVELWFVASIGPLTLPVYLAELPKREDGRYSNSRFAIYIQRGLDHGHTVSVLLHEFLHAICAVYGLEKIDKEPTIRALEMGLGDLLLPMIELPEIER